MMEKLEVFEQLVVVMIVEGGLIVVEVGALGREFILFSQLIVFELVLIFDRRDLFAVEL